MKQKTKMKKVLATILASAMALSVAVIAPAKQATAAKKAKLYDGYQKQTLTYNSHGDSRVMSEGYFGLESCIENMKKKATYSIKIKNKKVAKAVKNTDKELCDKTVVVSTGVGTTKGTVYEKVGKKKKTKVGVITIKVKKIKMGQVLDSSVSEITEDFSHEMTISPFLDQTKIDLASRIHKDMANSEHAKVHFKKSDYSVTYSVEGEPEYDDEGNITSYHDPSVSVDKNGIVSAIGKGSSYVNFKITFTDKSKFEYGVNFKVLESTLNKEGKYSLANIRDQIVGLNTLVEVEQDGEKKMVPQIGFDNAATTPAFKAVEDEVHNKLEMYGSIGRGFSEKSNESTEIYENTRDKVLDFLGADRGTYTCFYTNSTTDGLNKLASALITSKNDLVLTTRIEHHANDLSWRERCKVDWAEVNKKDGRVNYSEIEKKLKKYNGKVKIVSISAASNVTGYVMDVHRVAKMAHKYGAMIVVDGAQIVAHREFKMIGEPDDPNDDIDFIAFSAHKMYSPFGGGAVVGLQKELYKHMPTFYGGGTVQIVGDTWVDYKENDVAVYEAGSPNYPGVVGLGKAIEVLNEVGFDAIQAHELELNRHLIDGLRSVTPDVILYGDPDNIDDRVGVVTFNYKNVNTQLLAEALSEYGGVATRRGQFCAHPYVWRLMGIPDSELESFEGCASSKTPGMIRISFGIYNTIEEVDQFLAILPKAIELAKEKGEHSDSVPEY
ncbi:MAG: aminotransferase class V-fold PLP-dependent enzyme [Eubacterium sp.]|nr:aminotransferase class V-fold PLP-dependent enzyme [Eubacterium sp.]